MNWNSRAELYWNVPNAMDTSFCIEVMEETLQKYGAPDIFNTDRNARFTSTAFTQRLNDAGVAISMDGRGRWLDHVFIEWLWRSVKYECVYWLEIEARSALRRALATWFSFYNTRRPHVAFEGRKPMELCQGCRPEGASPVALAQKAA